MVPLVPPRLVNHSAPSGPALMPRGCEIPAPAYAVEVVAVTRPIESLPSLVNHMAPSGPAAIPLGPWMVASVKWVTMPVVVMRPMELLPLLVNQSALSGPLVMLVGLEMVGSAWVTMVPVVGCKRPIELVLVLVNHR